MIEAMDLITSQMLSRAIDELCVMSIPNGYTEEIYKESVPRLRRKFICSYFPRFVY